MPVQVNVEIDYRLANALRSAEKVVETAVCTILNREGYAENRSAVVTVLLTSDERLRQLNRNFAGEDYVTDVLSFEAHPDDDFPDSINECSGDSIGDVAISIPQTERQASEKGIPFERELAMLAIHGTLHLLGYDHASPDEEKMMFGKTDRALAIMFKRESSSGTDHS